MVVIKVEVVQVAVIADQRPISTVLAQPTQSHLAGVKAAPRPREKAPPPLCGAGGAVVGLEQKRINILKIDRACSFPMRCAKSDHNSTLLQLLRDDPRKRC